MFHPHPSCKNIINNIIIDFKISVGDRVPESRVHHHPSSSSASSSSSSWDQVSALINNVGWPTIVEETYTRNSWVQVWVHEVAEFCPYSCSYTATGCTQVPPSAAREPRESSSTKHQTTNDRNPRMWTQTVRVQPVQVWLIYRHRTEAIVKQRHNGGRRQTTTTLPGDAGEGTLATQL